MAYRLVYPKTIISVDLDEFLTVAKIIHVLMRLLFALIEFSLTMLTLTQLHMVTRRCFSKYGHFPPFAVVRFVKGVYIVLISLWPRVEQHSSLA